MRQHGRVVDRRCPAGACRHLDRGGDARAGGALCQAAAHLFDWLVNGQVVPVNPAHSVRGPRHIVTARQTPLLDPAEARAPLDSIAVSTLRGRKKYPVLMRRELAAVRKGLSPAFSVRIYATLSFWLLRSLDASVTVRSWLLWVRSV